MSDSEWVAVASDPNLLVYEILAFLPSQETSSRMYLSRRCTSLIFGLLSNVASPYASLFYLAKDYSFCFYSLFPSKQLNKCSFCFVLRISVYYEFHQ